MDLITFPIQMEKDFHRKIKEAALKEDKKLKDFIRIAIEEKISRSK